MKKQYTIASAEIQDMPLVPGSVAARKAILKHEVSEDDLCERYYRWERERSKTISQDNTDYSIFMKNIADCLLTRGKVDNQVFSPLSVFHALAVIADLTEGNTQREILSAMGFSDIAEARAAINIQYRGNITQGGAEVSPSAMMWFDESVKLNRNKMQDMAESIYTGASQGCMTDPDYQKAISLWLDEATGSSMPADSRALDINKETKLIILAALYFHDKWKNEFSPQKTKTGVFHVPDGDVDVSYLRQSKWTDICVEDSFTALPLRFENFNVMWFVLPKEGLTLEDLLRKGLFAAFPPDWKRMVFRDVHMEIPKFDISGKYDLLDSLRAMGIHQLFRDDSLTPYTTVGGQSIKIDQVRHNAKIMIDERGCEASAYTSMIGIACAGIPEKPPRMDFVLNRPFLFVLTGRGKLPLFIGTVQNPIITAL